MNYSKFQKLFANSTHTYMYLRIVARGEKEFFSKEVDQADVIIHRCCKSRLHRKVNQLAARARHYTLKIQQN